MNLMFIQYNLTSIMIESYYSICQNYIILIEIYSQEVSCVAVCVLKECFATNKRVNFSDVLVTFNLNVVARQPSTCIRPKNSV